MTNPSHTELAIEARNRAKLYRHEVDDLSPSVTGELLERLAAALESPERVQGEAVAWRWIPSEIWGEYVITSDREGAEHAAQHVKVEPLYLAPTPPTAPAQDAHGAVSAAIELLNQIAWNNTDRPRYVATEAIDLLRPLLAALRASSPADRRPLSEAQIEVLRFLDGVGGLRGFHFGEKPPTERGNYWWRKDLRAAFPEVDFGIVTKDGP